MSWALTAVTAAEPSAAFVGMTCLNEVVQGATVYNRIGSKIMMKSCRIRFNLSMLANPALAFLRIAVVYDRQPNGAFPAIADVFGDSVTGTVNANSPLNIANVRRFTPIRDQVVTFDTAADLSKHIDWYMPLRALTEFKASAGNIGDITTGSLLLIMASQSHTSAPMFYTGAICSRLRYDDN